MAWEVSLGKIRPQDAANGMWPDTGQAAYRARHIESVRVIGLPFSRHLDAQRACSLLSEILPQLDADDVRRAALEFKSHDGLGLREFLIENCCSW